MKLTKLQKIFAVIYLLVISAICLNALFSSPATPQNSIKVAGHFRTLDKETYRNEDSYNLYLTESNHAYKIPADWAHCFSAQAFLEDVKPGQPVELYLHKPLLPFAPQMVASINSAGTSYLSIACVNDDISQARFELPVTLLVISLLAAAFFLLKRKGKRI